jgi:FtsH-binding integral membrane protein
VKFTHVLLCGIVMGHCWCFRFLAINFDLRLFMVFTGYTLLLAIVSIVFYSSSFDFSVMGSVIILCI